MQKSSHSAAVRSVEPQSSAYLNFFQPVGKMLNRKPDILNDFAEDVRSRLIAAPKFLSSKYFYDDAGSEFFRRIMNLPEYYLTDAETEIFRNHHDEIIETILTHHQSFDLIELEAGDGAKTALLVDCLSKKGVKI